MLTRERLRPETVKSGKVGDSAVQQQLTRDKRRVQGFGNKIPLSVALRQIVPDRYTYSFNKGVNHNTPISWDSGEDWRITLRKSLRSKGLAMHVQNRVVHIKDASRRTARQGRAGTEAMSQRRRLTRPDEQKLQNRSPASRSSQSMVPVAVPTRLSGQNNVGSQKQSDGAESGRIGSQYVEEERRTRDTGKKRNAQSKAFSKAYSFEGESGGSLRTTLQNWTEKTGIELRWDPAYDFTLREDIKMRGDVAEAVSKLLGQYNQTAPQPHGRLYTTSESGNPVLIIQD